MITSWKPVHKTRGSDYCQTLFIQDPSVNESIQLVLFHSSPELLPKVEMGSILSVTVKVQQFSGKKQCVALKGYAFDAQIYPKGNSNLNEMYENLREWWESKSDNPVVSLIPSMPSMSSMQSKYKRESKSISELIPNQYVDLNVMLVSIYPSHHDSFVVIQVTDYSSNPSMTPYSSLERDSFSLQNDMVLRVTLWDQNKERCFGLSPGVFLSLTNMKTKISMDGYLEGVIHGDKNPEKVNVQILNVNDERLNGIRSRQFKLESMHLPPTRGIFFFILILILILMLKSIYGHS